MYISLPLYIKDKGLERDEKIEEAINSFLTLLLNTPCGSSIADPEFGFIFNNLRFEIFNEHEGVVYDSEDMEHDNNNPDDLYVKKISGTSKNLNTFAAELKAAIQKYEKRLSNLSVSMTYIRETKNIYVTVNGYIPSIEKEYQYNTTIKIWN